MVLGVRVVRSMLGVEGRGDKHSGGEEDPPESKAFGSCAEHELIFGLS